MTGSVAVDVAIGLVFIFLIYSLLASIIQEIVGTLFGMRARNLSRAIHRMIEDENTNANTGNSEKNGNSILRSLSKIWQWIKKVVLNEKTGAVKEFYDLPVIKYLTSGSRLYTKPSYLNPSDFSKAILELLKKKGIDLQKNEQSTLEKLEHALSENNKDLEALGTETRQHIKSLLEDAQGDLIKFKANLENWFNSTMERASGWYKKNIQLTLFIIGMFLAGIFNINTIEIAKLLSVDKDARNQIVQLASSYIEQNPNATDTTKRASNKKLDSLFKIKKGIELQAEEIQNILGFQPKGCIPVDKDSVVPINKDLKDQWKKELTQKQNIIEGDSMMAKITFNSLFLAEKTSKFYTLDEDCIKKSGKKCTQYKYTATLNRWEFFCSNFWGYLLTALAISLGAPFWFDLLNKLVKLRSSIQSKSNNNSGGTNQQNGASLPKRVG